MDCKPKTLEEVWDRIRSLLVRYDPEGVGLDCGDAGAVYLADVRVDVTVTLPIDFIELRLSVGDKGASDGL